MAKDWFGLWSELLGQTTVDDAIMSLLRDFGIKDVPKIPRDDFEVQIEKNGLGLVFEDAEMYPNHPAQGGAGVGILTEVMLFVRLGDTLYEGQLPYGLDRSDNAETVHKRLGPPDERELDFHYDTWERTKGNLQVQFMGEEPDAPIEAVKLSADATEWEAE